MRCDSYSKSGAVPATIRSEMFDMAGKNWCRTANYAGFGAPNGHSLVFWESPNLRKNYVAVNCACEHNVPSVSAFPLP